MIRRGLAASGGAAAVTLTGWFGEQTAAKSTARVAARTIDNLAPRIQLFQKNFFSTASSATVVKPIEAVAPTKSSLSFVQWYEGHLERSPILTKSVTGGILWGLGDAVAQLMPHFAFEAEGEKKELVYDWARTGRAVTFGGVIHAPTSHLHFNFLEWMTVRAGVSGLAIPVFKTIMEQVRYSFFDDVVDMSSRFCAHFFCLFSFWRLLEIVRVLELDFQFYVPRCHGCHARDDTQSNL